MSAAAPNIAADLRSEVAQVADFDQVRYAQSWEDPELLRGALAPDADSRILSIAAAGDNSFALLLQGAGHVVSIDMSPAQCALVELKRAAIRTLTYEQLLRFVGVTEGADRHELYRIARAQLPDSARPYWDSKPALIERGIIHIGKLEHMWQVFHTRVLPFIHGRRTREAAFAPMTPDERLRFWNRRWNNLRWRLVTRIFFSGPVIAKLGRDPAFFEHVQIDVGKHYTTAVRQAFVDLDPSTNPFLQYIMLGRYTNLAEGHPWLQEANFQLLRERLDRLEVRCEELESYLATQAPAGFTGFNLSDIFEWMSDDLHDRVYRALVEVAAPGARLAYWNNLVVRSAPTSLLQAGVVTADPQLAERLHATDRAFLYRGFHVDTVAAGGAT